MSSIYSQASHVSVWLGPATDDTAEAVRLMTDLSRFAQRCFEELSLPLYSLLNPARDDTWPKAARTSFDLHELSSRVNSLVVFLGSPWFSRVWVIQEVALCQGKATLYCGNVTLSWPVFETSILALWQCQLAGLTEKPPGYGTITKINRAIALAQTTAQFRMTSNCNHTEHHGLSMLWLLLTNRSTLATDPRDYIYGLLGMATPDDTQDSRMFITPDYALDAAEVYQRVTERFLVRFPTFTILSYLRLRHPIHPKPHDLSLPSWVVDWSADGFADLQIPTDINERCQHGVTEWYDACLVKLYPKVHEIDGRLLKVSGFILDYIVECSPLDVVKEALQRYQTIKKLHLAVILFMGLHRAATVWKYDHDSEQAANGASSIATYLC